MPPEDMIRPWVLLQSFDLDITRSGGSYTIIFKDPNNPRQYWGGFTAENAGLVKFITKTDKDLKKTATEIVGAAATDEEKLSKLYEFCQTQIKNTSFDTVMTDEEKKAGLAKIHLRRVKTQSG